MTKKNNMKKAVYEIFGVGQSVTEPEMKSVQPPPKDAALKPTAPAEKKLPEKAPETKLAASFLAPGTSFEGTLRSKGDVEIAGELKGDVAAEGAVLLRSNIQSNIVARSVKLSGCALVGDVTANGPVTVSEDSKITGNVTAKELLCAGEIAGDLKIVGSTQLEANARVSGSVVTGTLAVVKGAVINGSIEIKKTAGEVS